ncbi:hypothetical protein [Bacillus wiedmannii]|uniref:hypothetical protein n=1 Tax=Bacillus wiedmannii TaxID=1890302 RepID=UPI000BF08F83|nr:hypothetical protein [Bacillus wiedmannii]PEO37577.1 hypothetical protein CN555_17405 [Bacillus wiedmannii]
MSPLELLNALISDPSSFKYVFLYFIAFNILIIVVGVLVKNKTVSYLGSGLTVFFIALFFLSQLK